MIYPIIRNGREVTFSFFPLGGIELQKSLIFLIPRRSNKAGIQFSAQHTVDYSIITMNQTNSWFIQNYHSPKNIHCKSVPEPIKKFCMIFLQQNIDQDGHLSPYSSSSLITFIILLFWPLMLSIVLSHLLYSVIF